MKQKSSFYQGTVAIILGAKEEKEIFYLLLHEVKNIILKIPKNKLYKF